MNKTTEMPDISAIGLHYQPQINLVENTVRGYEALSRVETHEERDLFFHTEFIGLLTMAGAWPSLWPSQLVCVGLVQKKLKLKQSIALNLLPNHLYDKNDDFMNVYRDSISLGLFNPKQLEIELTEDFTQLDFCKVNKVIDELNNYGTKVVIDDFGVGSWNLEHLNRLNVQGIKIDKSFVRQLADVKTNRVIVNSLVNIAKSKGSYVIAEGIETEIQNAIVKDLGCDFGQGWFHGKPQSSII